MRERERGKVWHTGNSVLLDAFLVIYAYLEFVDDAVAVQQIDAEVAQRRAGRGVAQGEYVKGPLVDQLKIAKKREFNNHFMLISNGKSE